MAYQWKTGQVVRYKLTAVLTGSLPIMQNVEPIDLDGSITIVYKVIPKTVDRSGNAALDFRIELAEAELAKIPLPVPFEDAQKVLNRSVTFARSGEVVSVKAGPPLPFAVSIPGVDPQRLYTLVCPIVFPDRPVKPGDTWEYRSELLGTEGAPAQFRATVLESPLTDADLKSVRIREPALRVQQDFSMAVDQRLNADKKPVAEGEPVRKTRSGTITGSGVMAFSPKQGRLLQGHLTIQANITERFVGEPDPDQPAETVTNVKAVVRVMPVPPKPATGTAGRKKK
jgi:hypothetical protein